MEEHPPGVTVSARVLYFPLKDTIGYVEVREVMGSDLMVVNAARESYAKESSTLTPADIELIHFLATNGHTSPFFHPQIQLRIKMPIFVAREWFRSNVGFARNEMSRRYVHDPPEFYVPEQVRAKDATKKQGSVEEKDDARNQKLTETYESDMRDCADSCADLYDRMINDGVASEVARMILPQSTYTEFIETGSLAAYARLCRQRVHPRAQLETRLYAETISKILALLFPHAWAALMH